VDIEGLKMSRSVQTYNNPRPFPHRHILTLELSPHSVVVWGRARWVVFVYSEFSVITRVVWATHTSLITGCQCIEVVPLLSILHSASRCQAAPRRQQRRDVRSRVAFLSVNGLPVNELCCRPCLFLNRPTRICCGLNADVGYCPQQSCYKEYILV